MYEIIVENYCEILIHRPPKKKKKKKNNNNNKKHSEKVFYTNSI